MPCDGRARDGRRNKRARTLSPAPECRPRRSRSGKVDREQRTKDSPRQAGLGPSLLALTGIPASEIVPRRDHDPLLPFSSFCSDELLKGRVKNVFTLWPKAVAPSRTFPHAVFAWGHRPPPLTRVRAVPASAAGLQDLPVLSSRYPPLHFDILLSAVTRATVQSRLPATRVPKTEAAEVNASRWAFRRKSRRCFPVGHRLLLDGNVIWLRACNVYRCRSDDTDCRWPHVAA